MNQQLDLSVGDQLPPDLVAKFSAYVEPDEDEEDIKDAVKEWADELEVELGELLDKGFSIFAKRPPRERLAGFLAETLREDAPLVLNPDYLKLRQAGLMPPLWAETLLAEYEAAQAAYAQVAMQAQQMGMPPPEPPQVPKPPMLWPLLLQAPDYCWETVARDFRRLVKDAENI